MCTEHLGLWVCPQLCRGIFKWGGVSPEVYGQFTCLPRSDTRRHFPSVLFVCLFSFPFLPLVSKVSLQRETGPSSCSTNGQAELHQPPSPPPPLPGRPSRLTDGLADSPPLPSLPNTSLALQPPWGPIYSLWLHSWMISGVLVCWVDNFFFFFLSFRCSICCKSKRKARGNHLCHHDADITP